VKNPKTTAAAALIAISALVLGSGSTACSGDDEPGGVGSDDEWLDEYGVGYEVDPAPALGKEDGPGRLGPQTSWDGGPSRVWEVTRQWSDKTPEAGLAWAAASDLDWDQKHSAWLASMPIIRGANDRYDTFELSTPHGRKLPAPVLECAEVAIFLRATFAAWYGLPFYLQASDKGKPLYIGHFGFLGHDGSNFGRSPNFQTRYKDHTRSWQVGQGWPSDDKLRGRGLYGGGDEVPFLDPVAGKEARAGAYFDEIYLNKRVGHFMLLALSWFGSMHLADGANMFHIKAEALRSGDVLLERWQRRGIGHTIPVMRVETNAEGRIEASVATGSMPRRQPRWEGPDQAQRYFTLNYTGGTGENRDGDAYAALGGGIRRWRVAIASGSRYRNTFLPGGEGAWINDADLSAVGQRPAQFEELMKELTPEEQLQVALGQVDSARDHLRQYPASCSARTNREHAFARLYEVNQELFGEDREATNRQHRTLEDYVFAELEYNASRTCCWNSTTTAMHEIAMDLNRARVSAYDDGTCQEPLVFMARDVGEEDGYQLFREHARSLGRESEWVTWSEDEPCPWASERTTDSPAADQPTPWCELQAQAEPEPEPEPEPVPEPNPEGDPLCGDTGDFPEGAVPLEAGRHAPLRVCEDETDEWVFTGTGPVKVTIQFSHAEGDLDLVLLTPDGTQIAESWGIADTESAEADLGEGGKLHIRVAGYSSASARYVLVIQ
jgi:hypothetical protein